MVLRLLVSVVGQLWGRAVVLLLLVLLGHLQELVGRHGHLGGEEGQSGVCVEGVH